MSAPLHVLHTFANNATVPYLSWFAERAAREGNVRYTFLNMVPERPAMIDEMTARGFACEWVRYDDRHRKRGMVRALPWLYQRIRAHRPRIVHCNLFDDTVTRHALERLFAGFARELSADTGAIAADAVASELALATPG